MENIESNLKPTSKLTVSTYEKAEDYFKELLDLLPRELWQTYNDWLLLGMIIFNFYERRVGRAYKVWDAYCEKNSKNSYDTDEIETKLEFFKTGGDRQVGITKLRELCEKYNPGGFEKIQEEYGFSQF